MSKKAKETKSELEDCMPTSKGFDMTWAVASSLVPRLGTHTLNYDPNKLIKTITSKKQWVLQILLLSVKISRANVIASTRRFWTTKSHQTSSGRAS